MANPDWQRLLERLLEMRGIECRGCSDTEIAGLEERHGSAIPATYKDFLAHVGHSANEVFVGEDAAYEDLNSMSENARAFAEELGVKLADRAFVFWSHQGYHFYFFNLCDGEDPMVFSIFDDSPIAIQRTNEHLSDFLWDAIQQEINRPELPPNVKIYYADDL